jgi:hypothetical protein
LKNNAPFINPNPNPITAKVQNDHWSFRHNYSFHKRIFSLNRRSSDLPLCSKKLWPWTLTCMYTNYIIVSQPSIYIRLSTCTIYIFSTENVHYVPWHVVSDDIFSPLFKLSCNVSLYLRYDFVEVEMVIYSVARGSYWLVIVDCSMCLRRNIYI